VSQPQEKSFKNWLWVFFYFLRHPPTTFPLQSVLTLAAYRQATRKSYRLWRYHMLLVYNYVLLKMSTWCSKHVEENSILWINNNQCIKLVINVLCLHCLLINVKKCHSASILKHHLSHRMGRATGRETTQGISPLASNLKCLQPEAMFTMYVAHITSVTSCRKKQDSRLKTVTNPHSLNMLLKRLQHQ